MYEIQWFKIDKNIFNNRKIQLLLKQKDGDTYFRVWMQLLSLAVECGNNGRLEIGEKPITIQHCAKIMGKTSKKMKKILDEFLELGMLIKDGETFLIKNWYKYQSIDKYEKILEQNRARQKRFRDKKKQESNVTQTSSNVAEENIVEKNKIENNRLEDGIKAGENGSGFKTIDF